MDIARELESFIKTSLAHDAARDAIGMDEDLLSEGLIDSVGVMQLAAFIEENFGVEISEADLVPENFQSINSLKALVELKKGR